VQREVGVAFGESGVGDAGGLLRNRLDGTGLE